MSQGGLLVTDSVFHGLILLELLFATKNGLHLTIWPSDHLTWLSWTWARAGTGVEGTCHWPSGPVWSLTHTGSPASCSSALTWWSEWDGYSPGTSSSPPSPGSAVCSPAPPSGSGSAAGAWSPGPPPRPASSGTPGELVEAETEQGWAGERFEQRLALDGESPPPTLPVS